MEIHLFVAMVLARFDLLPAAGAVSVDGGGIATDAHGALGSVPPPSPLHLVGVQEPAHPMLVRLRPLGPESRD